MGLYHRKRKIRWNTVGTLAAGFFGVIFLGGVLLWLPFSNEKPVEFMDSLFMSTTAVCVTGLTTYFPAEQLTLAGKVILLGLIQIGGLGVIGCMASFFFLLRRKITVRERVLFQESYNLDSLGGIVGFVRKVILGTLAVEGAGAFFYAIQFVREFGFAKGVWYGIFHAVSAFCNAGIDILGDRNLAGYVSNPLINLTTMALIVLGGIGFPVWFDVIANTKRLYKHEVPRRWWFTRLKVHSKIVLVVTAVLLAGGSLGFFLIEYSNPETLGPLSLPEKILASCFQSVTTRTAGFYTISQSGLYDESKLLGCVLMFIGGSPGGTAGGIKTATMALLIITCMTVMKGGKDAECFGRRIPSENFRTGFTVLCVAFLMFFIGTFTIATLEPDSVPIIDTMYETASALGTVGLSADLTPTLCRGSQAVLIFLMYAGRIGPLTLVLLFVKKVNPRDKVRVLPQERIMIG